MKRTVALVLLIIMVFITPATAASSRTGRVISVALKQLGAPYELISDAPNSFNCVSFVSYCYNKVVPGTIAKNRITADYSRIAAIKDLKPGDIVGFRSSKKSKGLVGYHFGIYLGRGRFIHAANKADGVIVSKLKDYKKRFAGAVRIF